MPRNDYTEETVLRAPALEPCACGRGSRVTLISKPNGEKIELVGVCSSCAAEHGEREKKAALDSLSRRRKKALDWLDQEMQSLYAVRLARNPADAWVTVVDARRAYRRYPEADPNADLRFLGSLFRSRGWEKIPGQTAKNTDEGNHARPVDTWRYAGRKA